MAIASPASRPKRKRKLMPGTRAQDVDLTGGFKLDLKTLGLFLMLAGSWYSQGSKTDAVSTKMDVQEKARIEVEAAKREADEARRQQDASERKALQDAISDLKAQMKLTALDVADLKVAVGPARARR